VYPALDRSPNLFTVPPMTGLIAPLLAEDRRDWELLARGYKDFYKTALADAAYEVAWNRLQCADDVFAFGAKVEGKLLGIVHYLFHTTIWAPTTCYLQDLFVDPSARGHGMARALIERVAMAARERGALRLYWTTQEHNATARSLYDKLAKFNGFIRYDFQL
jgi:GNAT superfamily N-acetyltransferase